MKNTNAEKRKTNLKRNVKARPFSLPAPVGIFFLSAAIACVILFWNRPLGFEQQEFMLGEPALRSFFSPSSFSFVDEKKTSNLRNEQLRSVPPVYHVDSKHNKATTEQVDEFFEIASEAHQQYLQRESIRWKKLPFEVSSKTLETLSRSTDLDLIKDQVATLLGNYLEGGILSEAERSELLKRGNVSVLLEKEGIGAGEKPVMIEDLITVEKAVNDAPGRMDPQVARKKDVKNAIMEVLTATLSGNLVFDEARDREVRKSVADSVAPVEIKIKKNELIVQRGMLVTESIKDRLDQVHRKLATRKQRTQIAIGAALIFLLYLLSYFFLSAFEPKIFKATSKLLLFHTVILFSLGLSKAVAMFSDISIYLMPTALAALLLTLLLHNRIALLGGIIMTVMSGFLTGFRPDIMLATLLASLAAMFLAYRVRKRSHFLRIGIGIGAAYFLVIVGFQLVQNLPWQEAVRLGSLGFLNALFAVAVGFLVLPLLETLFDVVTDVSLLELSDLNHPVIKKMMVTAPGTYHHSLIMSSLAENACEHIEAHSLLARVGCYFHDIGKTENPEFFSENQGFLHQGRHDELPPKISFEIIVRHVKNGVRLARKYKLRKAIVDFIAEHQGTGVVYFFYKKAMDMAAPNEYIRADDFRYPGPKPQSKETAVVLLADSVEAASRSLKEPTPEIIQQLVRKIINDKFIDGQLDECELTLQDLYKIQASFVRNLVAVFHTRMKYPHMENPASAPDLFGVNQFDKFRVDR